MGLKVALVGMGRIGRVHVRALSAALGAEVIGVFESWRAVLDDPDVQCVGVLLPHDVHERYAIEALEAGKHVVCEKPLAPTLAECETGC